MAIRRAFSIGRRGRGSRPSTGSPELRTLVIETSTVACSVALVDQGQVPARIHEVVGRGHAERLVPMIAELPDGGRAARILVDCGPGSFTGVRVGLAAAIGLGIGWEADVVGYSSMALVAVAAFGRHADIMSLAVVMEGGHGEVFMQAFARTPFAAIGPLVSRKPDAALSALGGMLAVGNGTRHLVEVDPEVMREEALPDAGDAPLLPDAFATLPPTPIYGRAPDAKPLSVA